MNRVSTSGERQVQSALPLRRVTGPGDSSSRNARWGPSASTGTLPDFAETTRGFHLLGTGNLLAPPRRPLRSGNSSILSFFIPLAYRKGVQTPNTAARTGRCICNRTRRAQAFDATILNCIIDNPPDQYFFRILGHYGVFSRRLPTPRKREQAWGRLVFLSLLPSRKSLARLTLPDFAMS